MSFQHQQNLSYLHIDRQLGLPSGQVHNLSITSDGQVWMATPAGLSHYDGVRVNTYAQKDGLGTHSLRTVYTFANDELFVGSDAGLDQRLPNTKEFVHIVSAKDWSHGFIECVLKIPDGSFYLGTAKGLFHHIPGSDNRPSSTKRVLDGFIKQLIATENNEIWVSGKPFGVAKFSNSLHIDGALFYLDIDDEVETIALDGSDKESLLIGGRFGISKVDHVDNTLRNILAPIPKTKVQSICSYADELWIGTNNGLYVINSQGKKQSYSRKNLKLALDNVQVSSIKADSAGNVWVSSQKSGVYKFSFMRQFCVEYECPGLESVFAIRQAKTGIQHAKSTRYLLASSRGLFVYSKSRGIKPFFPLTNFKEHIWDAHETADGNIWLATQVGLFRYSELDGLSKIGHRHAVCQAPNRCLLETQNSEIYIGTQNGLARISLDKKIRVIKDGSGSGIGYVYTLEGSANNHFYVGTIGNGAWYGSVLGLKRLASQYIGFRDNVYSISENDNGSLIILCNNKVIYRSFNGNERIVLESEHAIAGWSVKWGKGGNIWIGTSSGLLQVNVKSGIVIKNFKSFPGGELWEFNSSNSLVIGGRGEILCGLRNNFSLLKSNMLGKYSDKPEINLTKYKWSDAEEHLIDSRHIKEGKWSLTLNFDTSWTLDGRNLQFRYRLTGFNKEWSSLRKVSSLHYNSLPVGHYNLDIQAYSPLFGWGKVKTVFAFQVSSNTRFGILAKLLRSFS